MIHREYGLWNGFGLGVLVFRYRGRGTKRMEVLAFERDWE